MYVSGTMTDEVLRAEIPAVDEYRALRVAAGLSPFSEVAAERGLGGTLFAATIRRDGELIAMGRLVGDGGCFFQVVDIAVRPDCQGRGLGTRIMTAIMNHIDAELPVSAYVSLIADGPAHRLYARFGFVATAPASIGMAYRRK